MLNRSATTSSLCISTSTTTIGRKEETKLKRLKGEHYDYFKNSIDSNETLRSYSYALLDYMEYRNVKEVSSLLEGNPKILEGYLIAYLVSIKSQASHSLRSIRLAAIKKFYVMNDIVLNWDKITCYLGEKKRVVNDSICYSTQQIKQLLSQCDERMRCVY